MSFQKSIYNVPLCHTLNFDKSKVTQTPLFYSSTFFPFLVILPLILRFSFPYFPALRLDAIAMSLFLSLPRFACRGAEVSFIFISEVVVVMVLVVVTGSATLVPFSHRVLPIPSRAKRFQEPHLFKVGRNSAKKLYQLLQQIVFQKAFPNVQAGEGNLSRLPGPRHRRFGSNVQVPQPALDQPGIVPRPRICSHLLAG